MQPAPQPFALPECSTWWIATRVAARCLTFPASCPPLATAHSSAFPPSIPPTCCTGVVLLPTHHPSHLRTSACCGHPNSFGRYRNELLLRHLLHLAVQAALPRVFAPALCFTFDHGFRIIGRIVEARSTALASSNAAVHLFHALYSLALASFSRHVSQSAPMLTVSVLHPLNRRPCLHVPSLPLLCIGQLLILLHLPWHPR